MCDELPEGCDPELRCDTCPAALLEDAMHSQAGQLIRAAQDITTACDLPMSVPWADIPADEFIAVKQERIERQRREKELRDREEAEARRRSGQ